MNPQEIAQKYGATYTPPTATPTVSTSGISDIASKYGATFTPPVAQEQPGFIQSIAQGAASPFLKVISTVSGGIGSGIAGLIGGKEAYAKARNIALQGQDFGYFGKVKPIGAESFNQYAKGNIGGREFITRSALDLGGTVAEIGSYAIGGEGLAATVANGLKGKFLKSAVTGAVTGAASTGLNSFGTSLQQADASPSSVAYNTLFGTTAGGITGGILGPIAPVIVKGVNFVKSLKNIDQINNTLTNMNTEVFKPTSKQLEKWSVQGKDPIKTYTEIFGTDIPEVGKDNRFTQGGIADAVQRVNDVYKPAAEGFNTILRNSPEVNSLSKAQNDAINNLKAFNLTPSMEEKAIANIQNNFQAIKNKAAKDGVLLGEDSVPVAYSDLLKDKFWAATRNFGTEDASISNAVNSSIGHGFKDAIENVVTDVNVQNYNKRLGDLIVLRDYLETKAGALAGTGGKATRIGARVAGTVVGAYNGPLSAILGNITGDKLAQIMINPAYQPYRWLVEKKLKTLPQAQILKLSEEAQTAIKQMFERKQEMMAKYALPAGSPIGSANNPFIMKAPDTTRNIQSSVVAVPANKGLPTQNPKTGKMQTTYLSGERIQPLKMSDKIPPTTNPTTIENKSIIKPTILPKKGIVQSAVDKYKNLPNKEGGMVSISGKTFKQIPDATKREMVTLIDYLRLKQPVTPKMERVFSDITEKYNINPDWSNEKIASTLEKLVENTKTLGSIATSPLVVGAAALGGAAIVNKLNKKK